MQLEDYRWLLGEAAEPYLAQAAASRDELSLVAALRRDLSPERVHLVVEQAALRRRARTKFTLAEKLFFTPLGLEQATDEVVAGYKAARFASAGELADLCCGIGGDLMALAQSAEVIAVDRDPVAAVLAEANCHIVAEQAAAVPASPHRRRVLCEAVTVASVHGLRAWHVDPDRRPHGRRTTRVELHDPPAEFMDALLAAAPNAAIKLAPAAKLPDHWKGQAEAEWISRDGQCRQLVAWFGELAHHPQRRVATVLRRGQPARTVVERAIDAADIAPAVGRYMFEPDAAVLAAKLGEVLADEHDLAPIAAGAAYLTGDRNIVDPALAAFEVLEVLPFELKRIKGILRSRQMGQLEIKKRGVDTEPEVLRSKLRVPGEERGTLLITRTASGTIAILGKRVER